MSFQWLPAIKMSDGDDEIGLQNLSINEQGKYRKAFYLIIISVPGMFSLSSGLYR